MRKIPLIAILLALGFSLGKSQQIFPKGLKTDAISSFTPSLQVRVQDSLSAIRLFLDNPLDTAYSIAKVPSARTLTLTAGTFLTGGGTVDLGGNRSWLLNADSTKYGTALMTGFIRYLDFQTFTTAYNERRQWDGGATNLVAATGRTSLGLNNGALLDSVEFATKFLKNADSTTLKNSINTGGTLSNLLYRNQVDTIDQRLVVKRTLADTTTALTAFQNIYQSLGVNLAIGDTLGHRFYGSTSAEILAVSVTNSKSDSGEYNLYLGILQARPGQSGRFWLTDWSLQGPRNTQPNLFNGVTLLLNNYYNGSPKSGPSGGIWIVTKNGQGAYNPFYNPYADTTYPIDVGLGIVGSSTLVNGVGFHRGIQVGGYGSAWNPVANSYIDTAIYITDWIHKGIVILTSTPDSVGLYNQGGIYNAGKIVNIGTLTTGAINGNTNMSSTASPTFGGLTLNGQLQLPVGAAAVLVTPTVGAAGYFVVDQAVNNSGKRWRVGHTGAVAGFSSFDIYNQTDNVTPLSMTSALITSGVPIGLKNYAVASLPSAATVGQLAFVTDATLTAITGLGLAVTGGGTNKVVVYSDGTNWIIL